jgi:septal ring factor EnvC (AmiA/AmiB activator)
VRRALWPLRRALAPAALELGDRLPAAEAQLAALRAETERLRETVVELRERLDAQEGRLTQEREANRTRLDEVLVGLHEARALNIRIAELTDLVTELVLPLHDREIDPSALDRLRPEPR